MTKGKKVWNPRLTGGVHYRTILTLEEQVKIRWFLRVVIWGYQRGKVDLNELIRYWHWHDVREEDFTC